MDWTKILFADYMKDEFNCLSVSLFLQHLVSFTGCVGLFVCPWELYNHFKDEDSSTSLKPGIGWGTYIFSGWAFFVVINVVACSLILCLHRNLGENVWFLLFSPCRFQIILVLLVLVVPLATSCLVKTCYEKVCRNHKDPGREELGCSESDPGIQENTDTLAHQVTLRTTQALSTPTSKLSNILNMYISMFSWLLKIHVVKKLSLCLCKCCEMNTEKSVSEAGQIHTVELGASQPEGWI